MNKIEKIKKFIEDNELDFSGYGSDLNSNCVILAGYCVYLDINPMELSKASELDDILPIDSAWDEFVRVYDYSESNNYGVYWETDEAKETYIF